MTDSPKDFDFSALTSADRLRLAQDLLDSVAAESQAESLPEWHLDEAERRAQAIDSGEDECVPWEEVRRRLEPRKT